MVLTAGRFRQEKTTRNNRMKFMLGGRQRSRCFFSQMKAFNRPLGCFFFIVLNCQVEEWLDIFANPICKTPGINAICLTIFLLVHRKSLKKMYSSSFTVIINSILCFTHVASIYPKESLYIRKDFNSDRTDKHGHRFIVLNKYDRHDVMWKHTRDKILLYSVSFHFILTFPLESAYLCAIVLLI